MTTSQNGWPVISNDLLGQVVVNGVAMVPGVRRSLVPLFQDLCQGLAKIETPHPGWCWGWAFRPIRGQTSGYSNHASGTAVDWNAPAHGRGGPRFEGFSTSQVTRIHALLERYDGVIRWGGDYTSPPFDPMHFEIVGTADQVRRITERLQAPKEELDMTKDELVEVLRSGFSPGTKTVSEWAAQLNTVKTDVTQVKAQLVEVKAALDRLALPRDANPTGRIP